MNTFISTFFSGPKENINALKCSGFQYSENSKNFLKKLMRYFLTPPYVPMQAFRQTISHYKLFQLLKTCNVQINA